MIESLLLAGEDDDGVEGEGLVGIYVDRRSSVATRKNKSIQLKKEIIRWGNADEARNAMCFLLLLEKNLRREAYSGGWRWTDDDWRRRAAKGRKNDPTKAGRKGREVLIVDKKPT